jgi:hypothetical protein
VVNDAISVTAGNSKNGVTTSLTAVLKGGDINYATALAPGDFVFCNIVNDSEKITKGGNSLSKRAAGKRPINNYNDGFKGVYKVQTCRKEMTVDSRSGMKVLVYRLQAFGFTEFNSIIYYDPQVFNQFSGKFKLFAAQFDTFWADIVSKKNTFSVQTLMQLLTKALVGQGLRNQSSKIKTNEVRQFQVPQDVGQLLGFTGAKYVSDIYTFYYGRWSTSSGQAATPGLGFNSGVGASSDGGATFFDVGGELEGRRILAAEYWNNVKVWNILKSYSNETMNEMYTTYRVNQSNKVVPMFITRQKTFTTQHYTEFGTVSRHLEMPRWKISPNLVTDIDLGKDEAARINFVQIYTRSVSINDAKSRAAQAGQENYKTDIDDVVRHGLHPYLATANFDFPADGGSTPNTEKGKEWASIVSDWLFGGHLKESGTLTCIGIDEPISVGDKCEFDSIVYEIESVADTIAISKDGQKQFRTKLGLSYGMDKRSSGAGPVYAEMDNTYAQSDNALDYKQKRIKPGISDTQDISGRQNGEATRPTKEPTFNKAFKPKEKQVDKNDGTEEESKVRKDNTSPSSNVSNYFNLPK